MSRVRLGLGARDRRALIAGAGAVVSLFAGARGVPAVLAWQRTAVADAATIARQLATADEGMRTLRQRRDTLRAHSARVAAFDSAMIAGVSPAAAAASLARTIEIIADTAPVQVTALQLSADSSIAASLVRVAVRITGTTDIAGLAAFLRAVEGGRPPLAIRDLTVAQSEPAASSATIERLRVDILIEAIARVASPPEIRK